MVKRSGTSLLTRLSRLCVSSSSSISQTVGVKLVIPYLPLHLTCLYRKRTAVSLEHPYIWVCLFYTETRHFVSLHRNKIVWTICTLTHVSYDSNCSLTLLHHWSSPFYNDFKSWPSKPVKFWHSFHDNIVSIYCVLISLPICVLDACRSSSFVIW